MIETISKEDIEQFEQTYEQLNIADERARHEIAGLIAQKEFEIF